MSPDERFAFWLAARLGKFDVDAMLAAAPAGTLSKWRRYTQLEPWGEDWQQASMIATQIINAIHSVATGMSGKKVREKDMLDWDALVPKPVEKRPKRQTMSELHATLRGMCGV